MSKFLQAEKPMQAAFKKEASYFSDPARQDGEYKKRSYPFCLPREHAEENLFPDIREPMLDYFARQEIKWHDGQNGKPSNHLCDSQVCCANFLFPFANQPRALVELLRPVFPTICAVLPMEIGGPLVSFEWIGLENYLGELIHRNHKRTRGANFTSADAAVLYETTAGHREIALIEWKYTESYSPVSLRVAKSGTDRTKIYAPLYEQDDCPIDKSPLPRFQDLFYEAFYQLMRQQLLAHQMEQAKELGATRVSVLHVAPLHNADFRRVTSPGLVHLGDSPTAIWKRLVLPSDRFASVHTEELFGQFPIDRFPELDAWWAYIHARYPWVKG